jgi:hypothetical protein
MSTFWIIVISCLIFGVICIYVEVHNAPVYRDAECGTDPAPINCAAVRVQDIEPPHDGKSTAESLKAAYMEAEQTLADAHDPSMERRIRREMAACLIQGWPLDVAICQASYCFMSGACRCPTCRNLIER